MKKLIALFKAPENIATAVIVFCALLVQAVSSFAQISGPYINPANVRFTGGTINGATVGATTPASGAFTTLAASGSVSGAGFSMYLASPPAIGGTVAAAGKFTTLDTDKFDTSATAGGGATLTAGTATTDVNALNLTQTWNNVAVTFTGIKSNVTDTASNATSLLMDLQVGGSTKNAVMKTGSIRLTDGYISRTAAATLAIGSTDGGKQGSIEAANYYVGSGAGGFLSQDVIRFRTTGQYEWASSATNATVAADTALGRISAGVIGVGTGAAGSVAGTLSLNAITLSKTITAPGTTGAQTINKSSGRVNFAAANTSLVVTIGLATPDSICHVTKATNDATMRLGACVAAAGNITIYADVAPAAETAVNFTVTN